MIRNYDEIDILQNSLVILDIDETIITYSPITPTWWNDMKKLYTDDHAYNEWVHIISKHIPYLLDEPEFFKLHKLNVFCFWKINSLPLFFSFFFLFFFCRKFKLFALYPWFNFFLLINLWKY